MNPYVHPLTITRSTFNDTVGSRDEYGQPTVSVATSSVMGLVQWRAADEAEDSRSAGSEIAEAVIFLPLMDLASADRITYDGQIFNVTGVRRFEFGRLQHLEVDASLVTTAQTVVDGS
jgi:head-tail adaptor